MYAYLFIWSFYILNFYILLNMLLAIVMDAYSMVKEEGRCRGMNVLGAQGLKSILNQYVIINTCKNHRKKRSIWKNALNLLTTRPVGTNASPIISDFRGISYLWFRKLSCKKSPRSFEKMADVVANGGYKQFHSPSELVDLLHIGMNEAKVWRPRHKTPAGSISVCSLSR